MSVYFEEQKYLPCTIQGQPEKKTGSKYQSAIPFAQVWPCHVLFSIVRGSCRKMRLMSERKTSFTRFAVRQIGSVWYVESGPLNLPLPGLISK